MKKSYNPISDVRNETVDLTKRLFKNILDAVHNLDDIRARANCVGNLFTRYAITQRVRLRDCCERLIFCDKSGYARKAEELLWRKGYYEVISTAKRLRKGNNMIWLPDEAAFVHQHVLAGVGQYHHLLSRLQFDCGIDLRGIIDNPVLYLDEGLKKGKNSTLTVNGRNKAVAILSSGEHSNILEGNNNNLNWSMNVAHRCLIYLGDLCRYLLDLQPGQDFGLPAHYYTQALMLKPEAGMPFNQLGTLSGTQNYSLDAVYYYMRCMCCPHTFEGAEGNLMSALDKTARWLESGGRTSVSELSTPVSRLIARLLYLTRVWFCSRTSLLPLHKVCDELLIDLPNCLSDNSTVNAETTAQQEIDDLEDFFLKRSHLNEQLMYLSGDKLFKVVVILLMCMQHLEKKGSEEFMRVVALLLAIISQFLQEALQQLEKVLPLPVAPLPPTPPITENNVAVNGVSKRRHRRRRRRRRGSSEGSDLSEGDDIIYVSSTDSDISEEELVFDEHKSEDTDAEDEIVVNGKTPSENGLAGKNDAEMERGDVKCDVVISECDSRHVNRPTTLWNSLDKENETFRHVQVLMQQGYLLQTIKICFDWLTCNMEVLRSCSQGCKPLIHRTASFLNYLIQVPMPSSVKTEKIANVTSSISVTSAQLQNVSSSELNNCGIKSDKHIDNGIVNKHHSNNFFDANDEIVQLPLPEDLSLRGLPIFSWAHSKLVWNKLLSQRLSVEQESYLRICKLVRLGMRLADEKDTTSLLFDCEKKWFSVENGNEQGIAAPFTTPGVATPNAKKSELSSGTTAVISANSAVTLPKPESIALKHDKLMQDMGQLWLRAEVKELETKVKKTAPHLPPYLVLDCDALTLHCPLVKQLAAARKFIILIPTVVVSALDEQKRSSGRVRDTIRWLESQFRHGNRFLRAQRANEHLPLPLIKYPKKKDKEAWLFFQIVECCHFLNTQGGSKDSGLVTLLTGSPTLLSGSNTPGFSPLGIVNSAGISIEHIESFLCKWKSSYKSHG